MRDKLITAVLIGAGARGMDSYGPYALLYPDKIKFVAVAEPDIRRRKAFAEAHDISEKMQFETWEDLLGKERLSDVLLICTQDSRHFKPAIQAIDRGYSILLEKPISNSLSECVELTDFADKKNARVEVCHVLRHVPFWVKVKSVIDTGVLGDIISIQHNENVGFFHYAHSYVRGNWRNSETSSPMILAKSCHDMDLLAWLMGRKCVSVSSYGDLIHFKNINAPENSSARCTDGCGIEGECPFSAYRYLDPDNIFRTIVYRGTDTEGLIRELQTGQYGRCVYHCDNNVVDHQVVLLNYEGNITAAFTMCAFTHETSRTMKIMGTRGELRCHMEKSEIELHEFIKGNVTCISVKHGNTLHSGGDEELMRNFVTSMQRNTPGTGSVNSIQKALESHLIAFAAEKSRITGETIELGPFKEMCLR